MSSPTRYSSPPKRPRLSLQIDTPSTAQSFGKSSTALKAGIDPTSPTALNTLSNAYVPAVDTPSTAKPLPSTKSNPFSKPISLRLETQSVYSYIPPSQRTNTPGPFAISYPDTPISVITPHLDLSSLATAHTFTPPLSASSTDLSQPKFTFAANVTDNKDIASPRTLRRRATIGSQYQAAPYTHPRSLHSILRNSPLPPRSTITPGTPTRMSARIASRSAKKVGYNDPLTQTIITNKYVKSHIDLLAEDSPYSATDPESAVSDTLDATMAYTGDETRDGGQTPGPFEEMRRRMADSDLSSPTQRKRKPREKKRKWEWTISAAETEDPAQNMNVEPTPVTAIKVKETPITAIWREASISTDDASDAESNFRDHSVDPPMKRVAKFDYPGPLERVPQDPDDRPLTSQSL